ncbi:hypothetical protein V1460_17140 [Streptomyces sp. SCSIO 30461]|uniref:hypothetical protein n=1 Tax=Streptomyces sp. SCSIO 30461 TaxID=3118085 RepID=UPI0030D3D1D2
MTAFPARSPRLLLTVSAVLAVAGVILLTVPDGSSPPVGRSQADQPARTSSTASMQTSAPQMPPRGEGVAGDAAIQQSLETAWPADLAAADESQLVAAGRGLLRADATGIGRAHWPAVFPASRQDLAPAFATARFRIQATVARRAGGPDTAVVHLVWAGSNRGGTFTDRRVTDWHFIRTTTLKGASTWTPQPRI